MSDEHRDDAADRRRADVYSSARIGADDALTLVLVVLLVLDVAVPDYDTSPGILLPLLGAILALLGLEALRLRMAALPPVLPSWRRRSSRGPRAPRGPGRSGPEDERRGPTAHLRAGFAAVPAHRVVQAL